MLSDKFNKHSVVGQESLQDYYLKNLVPHKDEAFIPHFIKSLNPEHRDTAKAYLKDMYDLKSAADPMQHYLKSLKFDKFLESIGHEMASKGKEVPTSDVSKKSWFLYGTRDYFSYTGAGTKLWSYFPNPFGVFAYTYEYYWAVRRSLDVIRTAVKSDGFFLEGSKGLKEARLSEVYKKIIDAGIEEAIPEIIVHLQLYGNVFILPHKKLGKLVKLELLYPPRLYPIFNKITQTIIGWEYINGSVKERYDVKDILHLKQPSPQNNQLGCPVLTSAITEIETCLNAANLNNLIFQKGGLIGGIVALKSPTQDSSGLPSSNSTIDVEWVQQVQASLDYLWAGTKGGQGLIAIPDVDNYYETTSIGDLDANWKQGKMDTAKMIAQLLGVPSEKIGIPRSTTAQYQPSLVENVVNAQFDQTINSLTSEVYQFLNRKVLKPLMDISDVKIVAAGRYGALTLAAAQTITYLAQTGNLITVNEAREKILGWEPLPQSDPRGNMVLNISVVDRNPESKPLLVATDQGDPELDIDLQEEDKGIILNEEVFMKVGGTKNDGQICKGNQKGFL